MIKKKVFIFILLLCISVLLITAVLNKSTNSKIKLSDTVIELNDYELENTNGFGFWSCLEARAAYSSVLAAAYVAATAGQIAAATIMINNAFIYMEIECNHNIL